MSNKKSNGSGKSQSINVAPSSKSHWFLLVVVDRLGSEVYMQEGEKPDRAAAINRFLEDHKITANDHVPRVKLVTEEQAAEHITEKKAKAEREKIHAQKGHKTK